MIERNALHWKRAWWVIATGVVEPLMYLLGLGFGMGGLVGDISIGGRELDYSSFIAPGLMASSAATGALFDSTFNFFYKLKFSREFEGVLHTPISLGQIVVGEIGWAVFRGGLYATFFVVTMLSLGLIESWWGVLMVPASLLIATAFATIGMSITTFVRTWDDFDLLDLITQPLFLASTAFFPLSVYPPAVGWLIQLTPLYHGVTLMRDLSLGLVGPSDLVHVIYFVGLAGFGAWFTSRRLRMKLLS